MANVFDLYGKISIDTSGFMSALSIAQKAISVTAKAVTNFAKSSVQAGMTFDKSISQVAATMGKTVDEISDLREFAKKMGSETAFSASQAADALNYMALAGYDAETSMNMLPNVLNLAASGGMELARASDMITDTQSALGLSLSQTAELVDKMAKGASKTNTSVGQLGDAMLTVGGTAKMLSGGTTELATALGLLADNGTKGAEGGTALRNIILSLSAPTDKAAAALEDLGIQAFDNNGKMRDLQSIFSDFNSALSDMTDAEKTQTLNSIFNKVDLKSVNALLATSTDRWKEVSNAIDNAAGSAEEMAKTQLDNLSGDITIFNSALEGAQIALSDKLTPTLREFVQFGTEQLGVLTNAFKEDGIDGLISAIGDGLSQGINLIISKLPEIMRYGRKILMSLIKGVIDNLPQIIKTAAEIITELATGVVKALPELIPAIVKCIRTIVDTLTKPDMLTQIWQAALELIIELVEGIVENLDELIEAAFLIIDNLVEFILKPENISKLIECMFRVQVALGEGLIKAIPEVLKGITELIWRMGEAIFATDWSSFGWDILTGIGDGFKKAWNDLKSWWYGMWDTLAGSARDFWNKIKDAFSPMGEHFYNFGQGVLNGLKSIINGLVWGINEVIAFPFNKLNDALRTIKNVNILGAKPFDWIQEVGVPQIPYLARGGVLKRGQMAFLEGQGDEAVIPLSQNTEWIDKVAEKLGEKRQSVYYNFEIHIDKMGQTSEDDIEQFADRLMEVMNEKEARRRYVMA